jgi:NAD(P)-dependent dehydrogenase (short-subunit alcohol dehydrogenase family)
VVGGLKNKVALVTGAARGQGRSHALHLAVAGADIIAIDRCAQMSSVGYGLASRQDLDETHRLVEAVDRRIVSCVADVRNPEQLEAAVSKGMTELGDIDIIVANAGIAPVAGPGGNSNHELWRDVLDVNLTGVRNTVQAVLPAMIGADRGGAVILTGSTAALEGFCFGNSGASAYTAAKAGVLGLMKSLATELAPYSIRVNIVHPTGVDTPMVNNDYIREFLASKNDGSRDCQIHFL